MGTGRLWCEHCTNVVHDVSALTEREARRLLRGSLGTSICVQYRTRGDGTIISAAEPWSRWIVAATAALSACASHLDEGELELPDPCQEIGCENEFAPWHAVPDAEGGPAIGAETPATTHTDPLPGTAGLERPDAPHSRRPSAEANAGSGTWPNDAATQGSTVRVDFTVDPEDRVLRGAMIIGQLDEWHDDEGRLRFVPTRRLIADLRERWRKWARQRALSRR